MSILIGSNYIGQAGAPGENEEDDKSDDETSKSKKDALLRDLLICLVRKYRADEPKGGPSAKNRIWADLSREYHRLSGGLLNANQKQLLTKWNNLKFHARQRGKPNPGRFLKQLSFSMPLEQTPSFDLLKSLNYFNSMYS